MKNALLVSVTAFLIFACSKNVPVVQQIQPTVLSQLDLLQNKWNIDSVVLFPATGMSANFLYALKPFSPQYIEFRKDGKVYSYGGFPTTSYDTSVYRLLPDNKTFIGSVITNGKISTKVDTGYIMTLSVNTLIYYNRNPAREYGKWMLKDKNSLLEPRARLLTL